MTSPALAVARRLCATRSLVIGGHGVANVPSAADPHNLCAPPDRFRRQLELLLEAGFAFETFTDVARMGGAGCGRAALTFDDGMENTLTVLVPLLQEYGVPATVFVTTGWLGRPHPHLSRERVLTAEEVGELARAGIEIGAHTVTHPDLTRLPAEAAVREIEGSLTELRELTGQAVDALAYPFGRASAAAARSAGLRLAVTTNAAGGWAPLSVGRAMVTGIDGTAAFLAKLTHAYDPLFRSRPGAVARAVSRSPRAIVRARRVV